MNTTGTCDPPKLYPNPATAGAVTIEVPQGFGAGSKVEVYDVAGRLVLQLPAAALENKLRNDEKISSSFQGSNFLLRQGGETLA